jgi:hypothetical protein
MLLCIFMDRLMRATGITNPDFADLLLADFLDLAFLAIGVLGLEAAMFPLYQFANSMC